MNVKLARDWFAPNATLYKEVDNPHEFPDEWKDQLPSGAEAMTSPDSDKPEEADAELM